LIVGSEAGEVSNEVSDVKLGRRCRSSGQAALHSDCLNRISSPEDESDSVSGQGRRQRRRINLPRAIAIRVALADRRPANSGSLSSTQWAAVITI
jgi:hypothetical protein